jgi:hypothetical protein
MTTKNMSKRPRQETAKTQHNVKRTLDERVQFVDDVVGHQLRHELGKGFDSHVANDGLLRTGQLLQQRQQNRHVLGAAQEIHHVAQLTSDRR